jgi:hypothetical protein
LRRRNGAFRPTRRRPTDRPATAPADTSVPAAASATTAAGDPGADSAWGVLAALGVTLGPDVTLLQFSTVFCGPCRTTRALCADVARTVPGVRHLEVDAESHLDAVRALQIWRTPTVLVLDREGTIVSRAAGAPSRSQLLGVVGAALPQTTH